MKEVSKKDLPAVSGRKRSDPGGYNDSVVAPVPDYPQSPVVPTDPEGTGPGCG